jgi:hypothetical protein
MNTSEVTFEWLFDHRVIAYVINQMSVPTLQYWSECVINVLNEWSDDQPYLAMHDLTRPKVSIPYLLLTNYDIFNVGVTSQGLQQVKQLLKTRPNMRLRCALALPDSLSGKITASRGKEVGAGEFDVEYRMFFERDAALEWLSQISSTQA